MKNYSTAIAIVIAGALIAGAVLYTNKNDSSTANAQHDFNKLEKVSSKDHIQGNEDALITVIEYSDLECPFCKQFHETLIKLRADYSDEEFAWVFRHAPLDSLHAKARTEAIASECVAKLAGEEAFWEYTDKIFTTTTSNDGLDLSLLPTFAEEVGANRQEFQTCLDNEETGELVQDDLDNALAVTRNKLGTPFVVILIDDKDAEPLVLPGAVPYDQLKPGLDQMLADLKAS